MDEPELIQRLKRGDPAVLRDLVDRCGDRLLRSAFLLVGNEADAEDLVQDVLLQALQSGHRFAARSSIYTWLHGILLNLARHHQRHRRRMVSEEHIPERLENTQPPDRISALDAELASTYLARALSTLSESHREILVLRFFEGMRIREIAAHLRLSIGTVKSRLHYALSEMQKLMPLEMNLFGAAGTNRTDSYEL